MSTWDGNNYYFSGQGVVLMGGRDSLGRPAGLVPLGNCSALDVNIATTVLEHHESETGQRGLDMRLQTEVRGTFTAVLEKFNSDILATALRGSNTTKLAGTVSAEAQKAYLGKVTPVKWAKISAVVVKRGATTLTAYTNDSTPYDYKLNTDAGSIKMNDGSVVALANATTGGTAPSAVTVGNPTVITVANTAAVGDYAAFTGFAGADAALLNGKAFQIVAASSTQVSLNIDTTGKTITLGTPLSIFDGQALAIDYAFAGQQLVDAFTTGQVEKFLRFEGLNTADSNAPVVVELFRCSIDPMKDLKLISDTIQQWSIDGSLLADSLQTTGSKFFRQLATR